jgi:hypothetical protein
MDRAQEKVIPPRFPLPQRTLVVTKDSQQQILRFEGLLELPIGSRISLDNVPGYPQLPLDRERFPTGRADAIVVGHRLWGTVAESRCLMLIVELTDRGDEGSWMLQ